MLRKVCFDHPTDGEVIVELPAAVQVQSVVREGFWINENNEVVERVDQDPRYYILPQKIHWLSREEDGT